MLILLLLLELWWFRWWRLLATLAVPTLFPMCKICGCPLRLFVIVFVCCCKVEPIAAARAVSSPVVLVVQTDITHELRTHFEYSLFVWLTHIHTTNHRHTHKLARVTHKNKLAKMPIDFAFFSLLSSRLYTRWWSPQLTTMYTLKEYRVHNNLHAHWMKFIYCLPRLII